MIEPFYFSQAATPLFGIYHAPAAGGSAHSAAVLCYPMGQEYIRSHRAFLRLSERLASRGLHVLRFDYYGCGDSAGDGEEGTLGQWRADVSTAIDEVRSGCAVERVYVIGLRLGASLAAIVASQRDDICGIVLWEPVISGPAYLESVVRAHQTWLAGSFARITRSLPSERTKEVLGFPVTDALASELRRLDLLAVKWNPAQRILMISHGMSPDSAQLSWNLEMVGGPVRWDTMNGPRVWLKEDGTFGKGIVPNETLGRIVDWVCEVAP